MAMRWISRCGTGAYFRWSHPGSKSGCRFGLDIERTASSSDGPRFHHLGLTLDDLSSGGNDIVRGRRPSYWRFFSRLWLLVNEWQVLSCLPLTARDWQLQRATGACLLILGNTYLCLACDSSFVPQTLFFSSSSLPHLHRLPLLAEPSTPRLLVRVLIRFLPHSLRTYHSQRLSISPSTRLRPRFWLLS
jgi:hypothetical protein